MKPGSSILLSLLLVVFGSRIGLAVECGDIDKEIRKDCGYSGISRDQCEQLECCYLPTNISGAPWCFYLNHTIFRTTTQSNDVTIAHVKQSDRSKIPDWLKELLWVSKSSSKPPRTTKKKSHIPPFNNKIFVAEIQDELSCQKTYQLYKKIEGHSSCQINVAQREPCVEGDLPKQRGESECTGCLKLDCCYDPIKKMTRDQKVAPHCFKQKQFLVITNTKTATIKPSATTSISTQTKRPSSVRLQNLLNMVNRNRLTGSRFSPFSSRRPFLGALQGESNDQESASTAPRKATKQLKRKKTLLTHQPTMPPDILPSPKGPFHFQTLSSLNQNSKAINPIANQVRDREKSAAMSPIVKYILMKKAGMKPTLQDLLSNHMQGGSELTNLRKAININPLTSLYHPNNLQPTQSVVKNFDILKYLLKPKKPSINEKKINKNEKSSLQTPSTTPLNLLSNKVRDFPIKVVHPKNNPNGEFSAWEKQHFPPVAIKAIYETETTFPSQPTCFPKNCGQRSTDGQIAQRIVGGQWAGSIEYWPWAASLRRTFTDDNRYTHICGATLIAKRWMLTAAHCFTAYEKRGKKILGQREAYIDVYDVYLGQYHRHTPSPTLQIYSLESFITHPNFDFEALTYDVAVARFSEPVIFNNYVQPICLPGKADPLFAGERSWIVGWGDTRHVGSQNQSKLKELPLPLISTKQCKKSWPQHFHKAWICTEGSYLEDACAGDSGGPLVKRGPKSQWEVIGVAIAGTRQCSTDVNDVKPGIYTKVAYFKDFIDSATRGGCEDA